MNPGWTCDRCGIYFPPDVRTASLAEHQRSCLMKGWCNEHGMHDDATMPCPECEFTANIDEEFEQYRNNILRQMENA